jgi:hypothetical protein
MPTPEQDFQASLNLLANTPAKPLAKDTGTNFKDFLNKQANSGRGSANVYDKEVEEDENILVGQNQEYHRFLEQSGWSLTGIALKNAAAEVGFGALEGAGYLLDFDQHKNLLENTEQDFGNWFSDLMKAGKEAVKESDPIYNNPFETDTFRPTDGTWWASNFPSLASALSLMIPSTLAVKGLGAVGKLLGGEKLIANAAKVLAKTDKLEDVAKVSTNLMTGTKGVTAALVSRYMENTMESTGTFEETKRAALDGGKTEEEANKIAGEAASKAWYANNANLLFDIPQYLSIYKGVGAFTKTASGKATKNVIAKTIGSTGVKTSIGEGFEEIGQFIIGKEAKVSALSNANIETGEEELGVDRFLGYAKDGELWTSFTMGALGGGVFHAFGQYGAKRERAKQAIKEQNLNIKLAKEHAALTGNVEEFKKLQDDEGILASLSNLDRNRKAEYLKEMASILEEEDETLIGLGLDVSDDRKQLKDTLERTIRIADITEQEYDKAKDKHEDIRVARKEAIDQTHLVLSKERQVEKRNILTNSLTKVTTDNGLDSNLSEIKRLQFERDFYKENKQPEKQAEVQKQIQEIVKAVKELNPNLKTNAKIAAKIKHVDDITLRKQSDNFLLEGQNIEKLSKQIEKFNTPEGVAEVQAAFDKIDAIEADDQLNEILGDINGSSFPLEVEGKRKQAIELGKEQEFEAELDALISKEQLTAPKFDILNPLTSLIDRFEASSIIEDKEMDEIGRLTKTVGLDPETLENLFRSHEAFRNIVTQYYNGINEKSKVSEHAQPEIQDYNKESTPSSESLPEIKSIPVRNAFLAQGQEFEFNERNEAGEFTVKYDEKGDVIPSKRNDFGQDHIWLNEGNLKKGAVIHYEVNKNDSFNKDKEKVDKTNLKILLVHYIDGNIKNKSPKNRKIVGILSSEGRENTDPDTERQLELLRTDIQKVYDSKAKEDIVETNITTKVKEIYSGRFFNTSQENNPTNVLRQDDSLVLGLGVSINGVPVLQIPNSDFSGNIGFDVQPGAVYMMIPNAGGNIVPYRLFTKKLSNFPELKAEVVALFEALREQPEKILEYAEEIRKIVYVDKITVTPKGFKIKTSSGTQFIKDIDTWLDNKIVQVNLNEINKGEYNNNLSEKGIVVTDMMPYRYVHSSKVLTEPYGGVTVSNPKKAAVEEDPDFPGFIASDITNPTVDSTQEAVYEPPVERDAQGEEAEIVEEEESEVTEEVEAIEEPTEEVTTTKEDIETRKQQAIEDINNREDYNAQEKEAALLESNQQYDAELEALDEAPIEEIVEEIVEAPVEKKVAKKEIKKKTPKTKQSIHDIAEQLKNKGKLGKAVPKTYDKSTKKREEREGFYEVFNSEEEVAWFKERFPQVDIAVLENLKEIVKNGGKQAWGVFHNAAVYLAQNAAVGTTYHEAFHVAFNMFLNEEQQESILNEASIRYDIKRSYDTNTVSKPKLREVNFELKAIDILASDRAEQVFNKGKKNNWSLDKILTELQIPKEQKQLILDKNINNREEIITSLLTDNSFIVEINRSEEKTDEFTLTKEDQIDLINEAFSNNELSEEEYKTALDNVEKDIVPDRVPTSVYSNLTVPGGTNYTENEIATPDITPSIKGHAQFSTNNGIGWFRSDIQSNTATTRRVLEFQSDLFQKNRDSKFLNKPDIVLTKKFPFLDELIARKEAKNGFILGNKYYLHLQGDVYKSFNEGETLGEGKILNKKEYENLLEAYNKLNNISEEKNNFLQLLNKESNWISFFIQFIIQDSVINNYKKVLFPTGNTSSKIEGHTTLEEFKKQKEDRLEVLNNIEILKDSEGNYILSDTKNVNFSTEVEAKININTEIAQIKLELKRVETDGFAALRPIYDFYENRVTNILNKLYTVNKITDTHGNTWNEVDLSSQSNEKIRLSTPNESFYSEQSNDIKLEEALAEEFRAYIENDDIANPKYAKTLPSKIRDFFKKLYDITKALLTNNININALFYKIKVGAYKNKKPIYSKNSPFNNTVRFRVANEDPRTEARRSKMIAKTMIDYIHESRKDVPEFAEQTDTYIISKLGLPHIAGTVYNGFYDKLETAIEKKDQYQIDAYTKILDNFILGLNEEGLPDTFGSYYFSALQELSVYGIKIRLQRGTNKANIAPIVISDGTVESLEIDEEDTFKEGWQEAYIEKNQKDSLSKEVRTTLSTIEDIEEVDGKFVAVTDDLGTPVFIEFDSLYNTIQTKLADSLDIYEMLERLDNMALFRPEIYSLITKLEEDSNLRTKFYLNFSTTKAKFTFVDEVINTVTGADGHERKFMNYRAFTSNRLSVQNLIIDEWKHNLANRSRNTVTNKEGKVDITAAKDLNVRLGNVLREVKKSKDLTTDNVEKIVDILNGFGLVVSPEVIEKQFVKTNVKVKKEIVVQSAVANFREFTNTLQIILEPFSKGVNPLAETFSKKTETTSVNNLAKIISRATLDLYQSAFRNVEGKTVQTHLLPTSLSKMIAKLKSKDGTFLEDKLKDDFFKDNNWLQLLKQNPELLENLDYTIIDGLKMDKQKEGTKYTKMSDKDFEVTNLTMYLNNSNGEKVIDDGKTTYSWFRVPILSDSGNSYYLKFKKQTKEDVLEALYNVALQEETRNKRIRVERRGKKNLIKNYHKNDRFLYLDFLNETDISFAKGKKKEAIEIIETALQEKLVKEKKFLQSINIINKSSGVISGIDSRVKNVDIFLEDYFYNNYLSNIQISQITSNDIAYYENAGDFQKRNGQNTKPTLQLDINATYNDIGIKRFYNAAYFKDEVFKSAIYDEIKAALNKTDFSKAKKAEILKYYQKINQTDGQTYISLDRYKEIQVGLNRWNKYTEEAYKAAKDGIASDEQITLLISALKPFVYTQELYNGRQIPVQHKNSEVPLFPQLARKSTKLKKLLDYMTANEVDSVSFESVVKVGLYGETKFDDLDKNILPFVHKLDNKDYGLQQEVPEHYLDTNNLLGSQLRKLILADLDINSDTKYFKDLNAVQLFNLYQTVVSENLKDSYNKVEGEFSNIKNIQKILIEEFQDRNLPESYFDMLDIVKDKEGKDRFKAPLFLPTIAKKVENVLNSIFKNRITKQRINGASLVMVSNFGFDENLKVNINEETGAVESFDVMLPWTSRNSLPKNSKGEVDFEFLKKHAPELLEAIGYRIPTEAKYSIAKMNIVGFTPERMGGVIMLPADITTISGADFDIDKMYVMMHNFEIVEKVINGKATKVPVKIDYGDVKNLYDNLSEVKKLSKEQRDNLLIDMVSSILSHPNTSKEILEPGNFDHLKKKAANIDRIRGINFEDKSIADPNTQREIFRNNMAGRDLIGIFATHNTNHAVTQYGNVTMQVPFNFDGEKRNSLSETIDKKGDTISRWLSSLLAAVVDNVKSPVANSLNINTYTSDMLASIVRSGHGIDTALAFINQPTIREFVNRFQNEGGQKYKEKRVWAELESALKKKIGKDIKFTLNKASLSTAKLNKAISQEFLENKPIEYYTEQLKVLRLWNYYNNANAKPVSKMVSAMRGDTLGSTKSIADNENFLTKIDELISSENINGVNDLFNENGSYPLQAVFTEYGIRKPNEIIKRFFPFTRDGIKEIKQAFTVLKDDELTVKELNDINSHLLSYMASSYPFFDMEAKEKRKLLREFPNKLLDFKNKTKKKGKKGSKSFAIIERLIPDTTDTGSPILRFINNGSVTLLEQKLIIDSWEYLLESEVAEERQMGEDLIKYTYFTNAFNFGPHSFGHFIPTSWFTSLRENGVSFSEHLYKGAEEADTTEFYLNFYEQYLRNKFNTTNIVPVGKLGTGGNISKAGKVFIPNDQLNNPITKNNKEKIEGNFVTHTLLVDPKTVSDKGLIRRSSTRKVDFAKYVTLKAEGQNNLYRFEGYTNEGEGIYNIISRLGADNFIIEYSKEDFFLKSVSNLPINQYPDLSEFEVFNTDTPTNDILYQLTDQDDIVTIEKSYGLRQEDGGRSRYLNNNYSKTYKRLQDVNKSLRGSPYRAIIIKVNGEKGDNRIYDAIQIVENELYSLNEKESNPFNELDEKLKTILSEVGFKVEYYDEIKTKMGADAVAMADFTKKLISVANGKASATTLPEETSHVVVRMLKGTPLYERLDALIVNTQTYKDVTEEYGVEYEFDETRLREEAIGQLVGQYIITEHVQVRSLPERITRVIKKLWNQFTSFFTGISEKTIQQQVDNVFGGLATTILSGEISNIVNEVQDFSPLYAINHDKLTRSQNVLKKAINVVHKKLKIFEFKGSDSYTEKERELRDTLIKNLNKNQIELGFTTFVTNVTEENDKLKKRFNALANTDENAVDKIKSLKQLHDYSVAYLDILSDIRREAKQDEFKMEGKSVLIEQINTLIGDIEDMERDYFTTGRKLVAEVLQPFASDRGEGRNLNIEEALQFLEKDISFWQRFLDSVAEGGDDVPKIIDKMVKNYKEKSRLKTIENQKLLIEGKKKLERLGIPTTNFVFERGVDGELTGNILSKFNQGRWEQAKEDFFNELHTKYGIKDRGDRPPSGTRELRDWNAAIAKWFQNNTNPLEGKEKFIQEKKEDFIKRFGKSKGQHAFNEWYVENSGVDFSGEEYFKRELSQPSSEYLNDTYEQLSVSEKEFLNLVEKIMEESMSLLPERFRNKHLAPQIRKDAVERWRDNPGEKLKGIGIGIKESFQHTEDEVGFEGANKKITASLTDELGRPVNFLPIYFTNKLKNPKDLSLDIVSTLTSFNYMSNDFNSMNKIVDVLELSRDLLEERGVGISKFDPLQFFKEDKKKIIEVKGAASESFARYKDYLSMVIYGELKAKQGDILGVDKAKTIDLFGKYVSLNGLGLNIYAGLANPILGNALIRTEAFAGEYVNHIDILFADKTYVTELPKALADIGQRLVTSKLGLWMEKMDVMQDFTTNLREGNTDRKTVFGRLFNVSSLFFINKAGEHQMQNRMSLALAHSIKVKTKEGQEMNLFDAHEVKNNRLVLPEGVTIVADGKLFKDSENGDVFIEDHLIRFIGKQNFINKRLHGIYNEIDRSALQRYAEGRMALMFRKFIKPGWNRRFEKEQFNEEGGVWTEGFYTTSWSFLGKLKEDLKEGQFQIQKHWRELTDQQKANVIRTQVEVAYTIGASVLAAILTNLAGDDDDDWMMNMAAYQASRLYTELAFFSPTPLMLKEGFRLLKSPAAGVNQAQKMIEWLNVWEWSKEYESGKYKGRTHFYKNVIQTVPLAGNINKFMTPEEQLVFFSK